MSIFKRVLALTLCVAMLFSVTVFADTAVNLTDINPNTTVGNAVTELVSLGIINGYPEDNTYRPDNTITRGEFAKVIITFLGIADVAFDNVNSGFADVDSINHWAKKYIKLAADKKIVNGYTDGTFRADDPVKYVEAVKMIVCALNYGTMIDQQQKDPNAPWYQPYMALAASKGILDGAASGGQDAPASRGTVAVLIYNSLEVPVATVSPSGTTTVNKDNTALNTLLKKEEVEGVVKSVYQTGITTGATGLKENQVIIETSKGEKCYTIEDTQDAMEILGKKITAYASEGDYDEPTLSKISAVKGNTIVTVKAEDIISSDGASLEYYNNNRASELKFDPKMAVIFNGKYVSDFTGEDFEAIKSGNIQFICNDNDSRPEVAMVTSYEVYAVSSIDLASTPATVYGMYGAQSFKIPERGDISYIFSLTMDGQEIEPSAAHIKKWTILSVARSKDSSEGISVWKGIVTNEAVTGSVQEVDNKGIITIKDNQYKLAYNFDSYAGTKPELAVTDTVKVYLDHEGKIAAAEASSSDTNTYLGYLVSAGTEGATSKVAKLSFFGITGTTGERLLTCASSVRVDGTLCTTADKVTAALLASAAAANATKEDIDITMSEYAQLFRYTLNSKGEVNSIDTVVANTSIAKDDLDQTIKYPNPENKWDNADYNYTLHYYASGKFKDSKGSQVLAVDSSTKVILINDSVYDFDNFAIKSFNSVFTVGGYYRVEAYNAGSDNAYKAKYLVVYGGNVGSSTYTDKTPFVLANKISTILNEEENKMQDKVVGTNIKSGETDTAVSVTEKMFTGVLNAGDVYWYITNNDDEAKDFRWLIKVNNGKIELYNPEKNDGVDLLAAAATTEAASKRSFMIDDVGRTTTSSYNYFYYGTVLTKTDNNEIIVTNTTKNDTKGIDKGAWESFTIPSSAKIYVYDFSATLEEDFVKETTTIDSIKTYDELELESEDVNKATQVLIYSSQGSIKSVFIFK